MQPLTPNERRSLEHLIMLLRNNKSISVEEIIPQDTEYWLKILSMALAQNDTIEAEWRKR